MNELCDCLMIVSWSWSVALLHDQLILPGCSHSHEGRTIISNRTLVELVKTRHNKTCIHARNSKIITKLSEVVVIIKYPSGWILSLWYNDLKLEC